MRYLEGSYDDIVAIRQAASDLDECWSIYTLMDEAAGFTCEEADALAHLFRAVGLVELADVLIHNHGIGDDEPDDDHHHIYLREQEAMR